MGNLLGSMIGQRRREALPAIMSRVCHVHTRLSVLESSDIWMITHDNKCLVTPGPLIQVTSVFDIVIYYKLTTSRIQVMINKEILQLY